MKRFKLIASLLISAAAVPAMSFAVPVKYPKCNVRIREVTGSGGIRFSEDCKTVYVLPPSVSSMTLNRYNETANLTPQCNALSSIENTQANLLKVQELYSKRMLDLTAQIDQRQDNLNQGLVPVGQTRKQVEDEIDELMTKIGDMQTKSAALDTDYVKKKAGYAQGEGGWGRFLVESKYEQIINEYQRQNPDLVFVRLPLDQSFLSIVPKTSSSATELSAVLALQIPGIGQMPLLGNTSMLMINKDEQPYKIPDGSYIFGDALSGEIRLSLLGACPLHQSRLAGGDASLNQLQAYIAANATYAYQVQVTRNHSISYNYQELVRQIHEQVRKNGFLSRKTMDSFVDARTTSSWIVFNAESQDVRFQYTDDYIKEVKKEFLDRALAQIISIQTGSPAGFMTLIDASGKNGADEAGDQLGKCPNIYCQIGSAGFKVLSAIFGSSEATASLTKSLTAEMREDVNEKRMVIEVGTFSFQ